MTRQISDERKALYYIGMGCIILGGLLFCSLFITSAMNFGDFNNFHGQVKTNAVLGFGGMALMIIGSIIMGIGSRGLAGSGVILDPEQAREDLEPYSRMAGGMVKDALEEADINLGTRSERVIMVKCAECGKLNEEDSRFCQECGNKI